MIRNAILKAAWPLHSNGQEDGYKALKAARAEWDALIEQLSKD